MKLITVMFSPKDYTDEEANKRYHDEAKARGFYINNHVFMGEEAANIFASWMRETHGVEPWTEPLDELHVDPGGLVFLDSPVRTTVINDCTLRWSLCHTDVLLAAFAMQEGPPEYPLEGYKRIRCMSGVWVFGLPQDAADQFVEQLQTQLPDADLAAAARFAEHGEHSHFLPRPRHRSFQESH